MAPKPGPDRDPRVSRVELGFCTWDQTDPYRSERAKLEAERNPAASAGDATPWEVDALEFFDALVEAAQDPGGLGPADYDAPMGRDLRERIKKPWIGEFKTVGVPRKDEGGRRQYRLYFSEPDFERLVLQAFLGTKTQNEMGTKAGLTSRPRSSAKQTKHIGIAMDATVRWCSGKGVGYRIA